MTTIKEILWKVLAWWFGLLPWGVLQIICRLVFEALSDRRNPRAGLIALLQLQDALKWYVDQQAIRYGNGVHPKHRLMDYHRFFIERLEKGERVLDVGCGQGAVSYSKARAEIQVTGVDFNPENIARARQQHRHDSVEFIQADILAIPPPGPFSSIVMSNVLEHIAGRVGILKTLVRLYAPKRILLRVPMRNRHWEVPLKEELGLFSYSDPTHCTEYTLDSFSEEMDDAGLAILSSRVVWGENWAEVVPRA